MHNEIPELNLMKTQEVPFRIEKIIFKNHYNPEILHRHKYHEIFFFEKGGGHHFLDFEKIQIQDYSIHVLLPGQAHQLARNPSAKGYVIMFMSDFFYLNPENKDFLNSITFLYNGSEYTHTHIRKEAFHEFSVLLETIENEFNKIESHKTQILQSYLNIVLIKVREKLYRESFNNEGNTELKLLYDFKQKVEQHYIANRSVAWYCDELPVTYKMLNKITKHFTGRNPAEIISDRLMLEAKRLLFHTRLSIKEIAYELNFEDPSHFSKFVKSSSGSSPADLRESLVKEFI